MNIFHIIFLGGLGYYLFGVYGPSMRRYRKIGLTSARSRWEDIMLDMLTFVAWQIIPLVYIFSSWLNGADYALPGWTGWIGVIIFILALGVLYKAYTDLGRNWSPKLDLLEEHALVTDGIYAHVRHPLYAGGILMGVFIPIALASLWGLLPAILIVAAMLIRIEFEEQMLIKGMEGYEDYQSRVKYKLIPGIY